MTTHYIVRSASCADFAQIDTFDPFAGDRRVEIEQRRMLVGEADQEIIGYLSWMPRGFVGRDYITFLCVRPDLRRRGIALRLLNTVETLIARGGLYVSTEDDNKAMLAMLPQHGWRNAGSVAGANEGDRSEVFFYKDL